MKLLTKSAAAFALSATTSLVMARVHPLGNGGLYTGAAHERVAVNAAMPVEVRTILEAKCADCHSSTTRIPWYGRFAPVSWVMERDIVEARRQMDLSRWTAYSPEKQDTLKAQIVQQVRTGRMPVLQYTVIHRNSRATAAEIAALTNWAHGQTAEQGVRAIEPGDAARGKSVFERRCTGCHALDSDHEGPRLRGVFGRATGSVAGFPYSTALLSVHGVWNEESLDKWLTEPDEFVAGSNMDFRVPKAQERRDLIRYLEQAGSER